MAINDLGHEAISLTGSQAGHRHRHGARQGEDRRYPRPAHPRGARPGQDRARRRLPGRLDRQGDHDARPRRLGHDRGRARRCARGRGLRDLHRRRGRLHRRPAHRRRGAQAGRGQLRGDARDVRVGCEGDGAALGRVRAQLRCDAARPLVVRRRARARGSARRTNACWRRRSSRASRTTPPRRR